jgi:ribonuclease HI
MNIISIYTDGACSGNQSKDNFGGWGAILEYGPHTKELYGGEVNTTNNRMEMTALLEALKALRKDSLTISVFSDSSYLMNCFREKWYLSWYQNNWKTAKRTEVENRDLWEALLLLIQSHNISFFRVKGHVNLNSKKTNLDALYQKFCEWNGPEFGMERFLYITERNNRADFLANLGIKGLRSQEDL